MHCHRLMRIMKLRIAERQWDQIKGGKNKKDRSNGKTNFGSARNSKIYLQGIHVEFFDAYFPDFVDIVHGVPNGEGVAVNEAGAAVDGKAVVEIGV